MRVEKFEIVGGGHVAFADFGESWVITCAGMTISIGKRTEFTARIDPFPHAWRVFLEQGPSTIWFDVEEAVAMRLEQFLEATD